MMTPEHAALWQLIQNFELEQPGADFKFSARLTRENGWPQDYTDRVIIEYKKFIFLCCITDSGVTPSDPVDQAWHLHLTYTRSYWIDLCRDTIKKEIHHNPTKGGEKEAAKFDNFYTSTRDLYIASFQTLPPEDIWADNQTRFSDINFQRVNLSRYWLIRKPNLNVFTVTVVLMMFSCAFLLQAAFGTIFQFLVVGAIAISLVWRNKKKGDEGDKENMGGGDGCNNDGCGNDNNHANDGHGHHSGDSGCNSGCSGCSGSGCSGCGGGGD